jgi:multiple antibiotic resistance protein
MLNFASLYLFSRSSRGFIQPMLHADIPAVAEATFLVVAALFPIVNPLGSAAIFLNLVGTLDPVLNRVLAQRIAIYSFFILVVSLICGTEILSFFGISIYAVQIGGGLIVTVTGWSLLNRPSAGETPTSKVAPRDLLGNAFYPYTLPITVGPGSISVAITLGAHLTESLRVHSILSPLVLISALTGIVVTCIIIYICYRYASLAEKVLGTTGTEVFMRLSSFILICIGIQIICSGVKAYLATVRA